MNVKKIKMIMRAKGRFISTTMKLSASRGAHQRNGLVSLPQDRGNAITIAERDATRVSDVSQELLTVCELKYFWRIIYSPPVNFDGGGPEHLIHKKTGVITDKKYYQ
jgi:hypothetical protein